MRWFVKWFRVHSPHLSPSHHQRDPDLCVDDTVSSDLFSDDQLARGTSNFGCSFASGFDVDANSAMEKLLCWSQRFRCLVHVTRASWQIVLDSWQQASSRIAQTAVHTFAGTPGPSRQPVGLNRCVCRQETREMRRHHELLSLSCIDRSQIGKGQDEKKEERYHHDQPKSRTYCRGCLYQGERGRCLSELRPRTLMSSTPLRGRSCAAVDGVSPDHRERLIKACHDGGRRPWRVEEHQPYRRWQVQRVVLVAQGHSQDETMAHRIHLL